MSEYTNNNKGQISKVQQEAAKGTETPKPKTYSSFEAFTIQREAMRSATFHSSFARHMAHR